jgi:hypothetical protein
MGITDRAFRGFNRRDRVLANNSAPNALAVDGVSRRDAGIRLGVSFQSE